MPSPHANAALACAPTSSSTVAVASSPSELAPPRSTAQTGAAEARQGAAPTNTGGDSVFGEPYGGGAVSKSQG
ncbi:hypothetical protein ON010_g6156 [Phytophthora cinnamomi]|nr:hypothetical protein ON010_g6156 [Phytophthora cinnamomi]